MRKKMLIFMFLSLVFLLPMFAMAQTDPLPNDSYRMMPEGLPAGGDEFMELNWGDEGSLIYWHIDTSQTLRLYLVNSSVFEVKQWDLPIFSAQIEAGEVFNYNITLPYDDIFYFRLENVDVVYANIVGWYAVDQTTPEGNLYGISTNHAGEVRLDSTIEFGCQFSDYFGISNIVLYENDVMMRTYGGPVESVVTWEIIDYIFTTLGEVTIEVKGEDLGKNVVSITKTVEVVEEFSPIPTTTEPFDWIGVFEEHGIAMVAISVLIGTIVIVALEKAGKLP